MTSPWISGLRSVAFNVPDVEATETFYTSVWGLRSRPGSTVACWRRGAGSDHHLLELWAGTKVELRSVTLRATDRDALDVIVRNAFNNQARVIRQPAPIPPGIGGGWGARR